MASLLFVFVVWHDLPSVQRFGLSPYLQTDEMVSNGTKLTKLSSSSWISCLLEPREIVY